MKSDSSRHWKALVLLFLALAAVGGSLYEPGIRGKYYSDDYKFVFSPVPENPLHFFSHRNPNNAYAYRPLEATFLLAVQENFGMETWPVHAVQLLLHVIISWLVFVWMRARGYGNQAAILGSIFMLTSQANVSAVAGNDTFSQVTSTIFGTVALWSFHTYTERKDKVALVGSVFSFTLALLAKENSIAYLLPFSFMAWSSEKVNVSARLRRTLVNILPFLLPLVLFFVVRSMVDLKGVSPEGGRYGLQFGVGTLKNVAMLIFASLSSVSTVDVFVAAQEKNVSLLIGLVWVTIACVVLSIAGLRTTANRRVPVTLGLFGVALLLPMTAFKHVSELYVYNSMPLFAVPVGVGLGATVQRFRDRRFAAYVLAVVMVFLVGVQSSAVRAKTAMMAECGDRCDDLLHQIVPLTRTVPAGGQLLLVNADSLGTEYSAFLMKEFNVLQSGEHQIYVLSGRADFKARVLKRSDLPGIATRSEATILSLARDGRTVVVDRN